MITIITYLKQQLYSILSEELEYNVMDNPYETEERTFPYLLLTLQDTQRERQKNNSIMKIRFKIDIFSSYSGEKEILEMESAIYNAIQQLWDNEYVTNIRQNAFRIIDDKSTGVVRKHGMITYTFTCGGGITEDVG